MKRTRRTKKHKHTFKIKRETKRYDEQGLTVVIQCDKCNYRFRTKLTKAQEIIERQKRNA